MKKIILLLLVLFTCLLVGCQNQTPTDNRPTLIVGMECGYPPFNWTENKKSDTNYPIEGTSLYAEGYDVQIAKIIAEKLGCKLPETYHNTSFIDTITRSLFMANQLIFHTLLLKECFI